MTTTGGGLGGAIARPVRTARVALAAAGVLTAIWLAVAATGGPGAVAPVYQTCGLSRAGMAGGRVWQLVTHGLLHAGWLHLGVNVLMLVLIGGRVEHILGRRAAAGILLAGVVAGGLCHLLLVPGTSGAGILVGVSGGAMAWLLALVTLSPESRMLWPLRISGRNLGLGLLLGSAILALSHPGLGVPGLARLGVLAEQTQTGLATTVGHACHLGGGLAGWLVARRILRRPRVTRASLMRERARAEARNAGEGASRNGPPG